MRYKFQSIEVLQKTLKEPQSLMDDFKESFSGKTVQILRLHLPLQFVYPLAILLSPFGPLFLGRSSSWKWIPVALVLVWLALLIAFTMDRILEFGPAPESRLYSEKKENGMALLLHLPVSAAGLFFFVHPMFGFLMLALSLFYSITISIHEIARKLALPRRRVLVHYLSAILFWFIPLIAVLIVFNLSRTVKILFSLDWF